MTEHILSLTKTTESVFNDTLRAIINTTPAQNALCILHGSLLNHLLNTKTHGTFFFTRFTLDAFLSHSFEPQGGPFEEVSYFSGNDHKRGHPADVMAERSLSNDKGG